MLGRRDSLQKWTLDRMYNYIKYKVEGDGIVVEQSNLENRLQPCSHCGFIHPDNRFDEDFERLKRECESHADNNVAKNIRLRLTATGTCP